jgi:hypothetical protein
MTTFPNSPRLVKGGIVLVDPESGTVKGTIVLQYNPDTLTRTLQVQGVTIEGGDRSEALRLTGPPIETIKLEAEIDATDQLETADSTATQLGIHPQLAALETIIYPESSDILENARLAGSGTLEIVPMQAPLTLFVWSKERVVPVRVTEFSVTEEAFDPALNPIRAKVSLGMRVLTVNDLESDHKGSSLYMAHHQRKERLAGMSVGGALSALGIGGIP